MNNPSAYATWFLRHTGAVLFVGFALSLLLSPLVIHSAVVRSRCEIIFAVLFAILYAVTPVYSDMPRGYYLDWAAASAFGFAFTVAWLRFTRARSIIGWVCLAFYFLIFIDIIESL